MQKARAGRPSNPTLTPEKLERARKMRSTGMVVREVARELRVPKTTLHRALKSATI